MALSIQLSDVVAVWFSWSWNGFGLRLRDGRQETFPVEQLAGVIGSADVARELLAVATAGIGTGCWRSYPAGPGWNFADAQLPLAGLATPAPAAR